MIPNGTRRAVFIHKEPHLPEFAVQPEPRPVRIPRSMELALFVTGSLWVLAARAAADHAAAGLTLRFALGGYIQQLLVAGFLLFLLLIGFPAIHWVATRNASIRGMNELPFRSTRLHEWSLGAALGWGLLMAAVFPMLLAGDLLPVFWFAPRAFGLSLLSLATLALFTLALEVAFRGYLYERLIAAIGSTPATVILSVCYAWTSLRPWNPSAAPPSVALAALIAFVLALLFSLSYRRTHALWLGWGLHFGWAASTAVLFGLPVTGNATLPSVVDTSVQGSNLLTGGAFGPEGSLLVLPILLVGLVVLYRLTRDLAWRYTLPTIVAAGYPMDVAPPAAHTAMETAAVRVAPLVQILPTTPMASSTSPAVEQHLQSGRTE